MAPSSSDHVTVHGKFLQLGREKFYVKGLCYGQFAENSHGEYLPEQGQIACDLAHMRRLGANTVRLYSVPGAVRLDQFQAKLLGWLGVFNNAWETWDVKLVGDLWHTLLIHTDTEELGRKKRFTRARITAQSTLVNRALSFASLIWTVAALVSLQPIALFCALLASAAALMQNVRSRRTCLEAATSPVSHAAGRTSLTPADFSINERAHCTKRPAVTIRTHSASSVFHNQVFDSKTKRRAGYVNATVRPSAADMKIPIVRACFDRL